ncbi:host attachment protein [Aestuariicoccus sp. MJ-SS9]|uniref:host attachment protein n=1 Tax=Aestuariicoccus sp. MJ-SS9 TaxID=3079855 RepID=UPI00290E64A9|nr:host attachment protein [Aestuariicoccus sp. MJ-SS9]MDU8911609.1 host attachment protein [Aestuariicoccus sp. MJ-SS9]
MRNGYAVQKIAMRPKQENTMTPTVAWVLLAGRRGPRVYEYHGPDRGLCALKHAIRITAPPPGPDTPELARDIAAALEEAHRNRAFDSLILAAGPRMLGLLRRAMSAPLRAVVAAELCNDLTTLSDEELARHLGGAIAL